MNKNNYLEMLPLSGIAKYAKGQPKDGVPFFGHPRAHPSEKNKLILVNDPLGPNPAVLEFLFEDVMFVEEIPSAVTESGEGVPMVKIWIRRGAVGMILEPFEVDDNTQFAAKVHVKNMSQAS
ncbi:MAG: hypothetical protein FWC03_00155 [Treponema sp.]|nr:hypothetical protein [Treponema sp.]